MQENHYLVPLHPEGHSKDLEHHVVAYTTEEAEYWFVDVKDRLLDVNSWNKYCPAMSAEFRLTDDHGLGVGRHARKGDLIRMDIPGPGSERLGGFEWMRIEAIEYDDYPDMSIETFAIRTRTAQNPMLRKDINEAKYTDSNVTFTFVIERRGAKVLASYHGRVEQLDNATEPDKWFWLPDEEWESLIKKLVG